MNWWLIEQRQFPAAVSRYVGTLDLDVGLAFAVVAEQH